jgi:NDP-sugar pyrophosphorylase family protein
MKSYGSSCLLEISGIKLLDVQIQTINSYFSNKEIILCVGFDSSSIIKYVRNSYKNLNLRIVENQLYEKTNSCESLRLCLNNTLNNKIFVIDGSILLNYNIFSGISLKENILFTQNKSNNFEIGFNTNERNLIEHISYGAYNIWSEIFYLSSATDAMRKLLSNEQFKNKLIFEAINELIKNKNNFKSIDQNHNFEKINNIKTYHKLRK